MHWLRRRRLSAALTAAVIIATGCAPEPRPGSLPPTLTMADLGGASVAMQNGIPVPTFDRQPGRQLSLDGRWRVERGEMESDLSMTDRSTALDAIVAAGGGRHLPDFDDRHWTRGEVPGSLNSPHGEPEIGAWYRRGFTIPARWEGLVATLKFAAVNYVADVWVNGTWVGYHEGGYTPFAFDISTLLVPGERNVLAVRVDNPAWGSRNDILPWGLADWWNYGGITRSVWLEATAPLHVVRADVVPHLDGVDVTATVRRASSVIGAAPAVEPSPTPEAKFAGPLPAVPGVRLELYPAEVTEANVGDPNARALVPRGARPLAEANVRLEVIGAAGVQVVEASFLIGGADLWSPSRPALYVLRAAVAGPSGVEGGVWTSFGLRRVGVEAETGRLLLNGEPVMLTGVALHDEVLQPGATEDKVVGSRVREVAELRAQLARATEVNADLLRTGHTPANPLLLLLADRLGFAVWEEIPLYHYTPLTFGIVLHRGIAQQMLREMALRDMNRPSVLFHGLANESTGGDERREALGLLHQVDREIDGTRLTGQAAYGSLPADPTHAPLDVAGFTFYHGVFYGRDAAEGTADALTAARQTNPGKPILALEFGRWADVEADRPIQQRIFEETFAELRRRGAHRSSGYVGAAVWWALQDYATMRPGIEVEHFGLFDAAGEPRPVATAAREAFTGAGGEALEQELQSDARLATVVEAGAARVPHPLLLLGYAILVSAGLTAATLLVLLRRGGRSSAPARRAS